MIDPPIKIWRVNRRPRFTLLEMGEYMAADDGQRETLRRNLKYERLAPSLLYSDVHKAIASHLVSPTRSRDPLNRCRTALEAERENTVSAPRKRENATYALRALEAFERSINALPVGGVTIEHAPAQGSLTIENVKISVQPTVLVKVMRPRGVPLKGAIVVDVAKGVEPKGEDLKRRTTEAMTFAAMLLHEHISAIATDGEKSSPERCHIFHAFRQELVVSPTSYRREIRIIEAACRTIAAMWDSISPPAAFDPALARYRD